MANTIKFLKKGGIVEVPTGGLTESGRDNDLYKIGLYNPEIVTESDGSQWIEIAYHNTPTATLFSSTDPFKSGVNKSNVFFNVGICGKIKSGSWELMLWQLANPVSPYTPTKWRWIQSANPMIASFAQTTSANVTKITKSPYATSGYGGIYYNNGTNTYLCANNGANGNWWGAIGCWTSYTQDSKTGIPGYDGIVVVGGYIRLFLRIDNNPWFSEYFALGANNNKSIITNEIIEI